MSAPGQIFDGTSGNDAFYGTRGDDSISGAGGGDALWDSMGNDVVFAGDGDDSVYACLGNDWYDGGGNSAVGDFLSFAYLDIGPNGLDETFNVRGVTFDLQKTVHNIGSLGTKTIYGFENVAGSLGADRLYGTLGSNTLNGDWGSDLLDGRGGADRLIGHIGRDVLIGGAGRDDLSGYLNLAADGERDTYRFLKTTESGTTALTRDTINGFFNGGGAGGDKIDLAAIDANPYVTGNQQFKYLPSGPFNANANGEVRVSMVQPEIYLVEVDTDKDTSAEMSFFVNSTNALKQGDFWL